MIDRMRLRIGTVATLAVAVLATGCSGGGSNSAPPIPTPPKTAPAGKSTKAQLNVRIPIRKAGAKSSRRQPKYVSLATNEIAIRVLGPGNADAPWQLFDVSSTAPASSNAACTVSGNFRNCSITVTAPAVDGGTDEFEIYATDQAPASGDTIFEGNVLSTGYATNTVVAGAINSVNVGLTGVIGQLSTDKTAYSIWAAPGQTGTTIVNITANDFDGGNIAGAQPTFANPIVFADTLNTSSPFMYPSADLTTNNYGLSAPATPGPIPATITYTAPTTLTSTTTSVTVSTDQPPFLQALPQAYPTTTFTLNPMVVSVASSPVASVPGLAVSGSDVVVTVAEPGATNFTVTANTTPPNNDGSFTLLSAPNTPLAGPITATGGTATFIVHANTATMHPVNAPTISIVDANGTTATLTAVVAP